MKKFYLYLLTICTFSILGCQREEITFSVNANEHFFLKSSKAEMPVWVRGNTASKTYIIFLHGGPGGSSLPYLNYHTFSALEEKYAVVYWDQRCAGTSQGNCNPNDLTVDAYVEDLVKLVTLVKYRYGQSLSIFLLGDSWGGTLATAYITTNDLQNTVKGCIVSVGVHNFPLYAQSEKSMLNFYADQQIGFGNRISEWQNIKSKLNNIDLTSVAGLNELRGFALEGQKYLTEIDSIKITPVVGSSTHSLGDALLLNSTITGVGMWEKLINYDLSPKIGTISIPMALYYAKYDFIVPKNVGMDFYDKLKTTTKELFIFPESDHNLGTTSGNEMYYPKVISFIEAHK
ncbi:MAG: alpha/beta fold hydrolase [Saprospiraceae bacterium]